MGDELKAAVEWLRTLRVPGWSCCDHADAILAHLDGDAARLAAARRESALSGCIYGGAGCAAETPLDEPCEGCASKKALLAAAREEQREACARHACEANAHRGSLWPSQVAQSIRATPLDATPLADRIIELTAMLDHAEGARREAEARIEVLVDALRSVNETTVKQARAAVEAHERAEKAEAERDAAWLKADEAMSERDKWRQRAQRAQEERNSLQRRLDEAVQALRHVRTLVPHGLPGSMYAVGRDLAAGVLAKYPEGT